MNFVRETKDKLRKIKKRYKQGVILNYIYGALKQKKFEVSLFYLLKEDLIGEINVNIQPKIEPIAIEFLKPSDIQFLSTLTERDSSEEEMLQMLSEGCKCMGIKYKGNIVAWAWYNLRKCESKSLSFSFELKENEAYMFEQRTLKTYRGKSLAPYLKYQIHKHLAEIGRTKLYAVVFFSNIPSIKFLRKLNAKPLKLFLNINFLSKYHRNVLLKKYRV